MTGKKDYLALRIALPFWALAAVIVVKAYLSHGP